MARYLRVRATRPQGAHRAGMFFGTEPQFLLKANLSPDQISLLKADNGRLLIVDEVDDPHAAPTGAGTAGGEVFGSHPGVAEQIAEVKQQVEDAFTAAEQSKAVADEAIAERDAAKAEVEQYKVDLEEALRDAKAAKEEVEALKAAAKPKPKPKPKADPKAETTAAE